MNKVITINLNGRAYQLEEQGYAKLQSYLAEAAKQLENDPGKDEIVADLEQAIAEKFDRLLGTVKTVVMEKEVEKIVEEMGKVESQADEKKEEKTEEQKTENKTKRLYRLREGAIFGGVCAGLAAYFNIDVFLIRIVFVILAFATGGGMIIVYIVMMIILPQAETAAQTASAFGEPFTAQEFVDRARVGLNDFAGKSKGEWKKWRHEMRQKMCHNFSGRRYNFYANPTNQPYLPACRPLFFFISLVWFFGLLTLIFRGTLFSFSVAPFFPVWVAILVWIFIYLAIIKPLKWSGRMSFCGGDQDYYRDCRCGSFGIFIFGAIALIVLWHFIPASHHYFQAVAEWFRSIDAKF